MMRGVIFTGRSILDSGPDTISASSVAGGKSASTSAWGVSALVLAWGVLASVLAASPTWGVSATVSVASPSRGWGSGGTGFGV